MRLLLASFLLCSCVTTKSYKIDFSGDDERKAEVWACFKDDDTGHIKCTDFKVFLRELIKNAREQQDEMPHTEL